MNFTTLIRLTSFALVAFDACLLAMFPSLETAMLLWFPLSMAIVLATTSNPSRFSR
jgi:hypothetical protein